MKISIELEIQADEIPLATELLATLRLLTQHAAGGQQAGSQPASGAAGATSAAPAAPAAGAGAPDEAQAASEAASATTVVVRNVRQLLTDLLEELADPEKLQSVSSRVNAVLSNPSYGEPAAVRDELHKAFVAVVFKQEIVNNEPRSLKPWIHLLPRLPELHKTTVIANLISYVLRHLALKRPNPQRGEFFMQAEAFAVFVSLDLVTIDGAVQSIFKLMSKADTRSAAVTMLGQTVQLCREKLTQCSPQHLESLYRAIDAVTDPGLAYDVDWINRCLNRNQGAADGPPPTQAPPPQQQPSQQQQQQQQAAPAAPASAAAAATSTSLAAPAPAAVPAPAAAAAPAASSLDVAYVLQSVSMYQGSTQVSYALCHDPRSNSIIAGGNDPYLVRWDILTGQLVQQLPISTNYVCAMDTQQRSNTLLMCGVQLDEMGMPTATISAFDGKANFQPRGVLAPSQRSSINTLRALPSDCDQFVTSESLQEPAANKELLCLYDLSMSQSIAALSPLSIWGDHTDMVTCFALHPGNPNVFVSGSRDKTIRLWDKRMQQCAGIFGRQDDNSFELRAHEDLVTSLDTFDTALISASVDSTLAYWDFRSLSSTSSPTLSPEVARMHVDGAPILKIACTGCPYRGVVAVSTYQSLYSVDLTQPKDPRVWSAVLGSEESRPSKIFHDLKWAAGTPYLFGASEVPGVEVLHVSPVQL